jgi:hypothetical protein
MFKSLYTLSKTGEIARMKSILEDTFSKQENSPNVSVPQSPNPIEDESFVTAQTNSPEKLSGLK